MAEEYSLASTEADTFLPEALQFRPSTPLVDIGANLTHESFQRDLGDVLARAKAANVTTLIVTGTDVAHAKQAVQMAQQYTGVYATAGVHPHDASGWNDTVAQEMRQLYRMPEVVAVGECGLDFNRNFSTPEQQERAFEAQLALSAESGLPLFCMSGMLASECKTYCAVGEMILAKRLYTALRQTKRRCMAILI
ncbi:hypothetical protein HAALTHF_44250n [Vreelandella aquamarina]|nr:hypothetical protein HAALTHF_44250n [Halomonas axialensis]